MNARLFKGIFISLCLMRAPLATNLAENGQGTDEPTPKGEETKTPTSVYAQRYLFYCVSVFVGSYGISLILAVKTLRLLAENQEVYGEKTKKMQKQLTLTLALQVRRLF
ncbi:unnamed protein product [Bursaphelenchus xylophilus]|uniref:(pine wood nematode) hypothetical protein n=1 Tax=Bursaphelenchus xylophilus TaxID=6326 RepID=A0A7I8XG82_BURXY|nr:unnamed protein product [Bursaphelenchus xylophilus]CAG9081255.1 unnamed protein product [Bursaphelenchus xylophilus]